MSTIPKLMQSFIYIPQYDSLFSTSLTKPSLRPTWQQQVRLDKTKPHHTTARIELYSEIFRFIPTAADGESVAEPHCSLITFK
jgi:hypothetical protein